LADSDRVEPHHRVLREAARAIDSWAYAEGVRKARQLSRRAVEAFRTSFDLLLTPTMACLPPPIGAWRAGTGDNPLMALVNSYPMAPFTSLFNVTGQPAISVPIHHNQATGPPVGVQLLAAPWREDLPLLVSRSLELAHPWTDRRPPDVAPRGLAQAKSLPGHPLRPDRGGAMDSFSPTGMQQPVIEVRCDVIQPGAR
jgi:amidase